MNRPVTSAAALRSADAEEDRRALEALEAAERDLKKQAAKLRDDHEREQARREQERRERNNARAMRFRERAKAELEPLLSVDPTTTLADRLIRTHGELDQISEVEIDRPLGVRPITLTLAALEIRRNPHALPALVARFDPRAAFFQAESAVSRGLKFRDVIGLKDALEQLDRAIRLEGQRGQRAPTDLERRKWAALVDGDALALEAIDREENSAAHAEHDRMASHAASTWAKVASCVRYGVERA